MRKKKMYLFACIEKNIGDDLFIYLISKRYPDTKFIISSDAKYLEINGLKNLEYSNALKGWLKFANNGSRSKIKRTIAMFLRKLYRIRLKKMDSIYIVGNAFKNMNYKGKYQIDWLKRRVNLSNKFYLISTNYGPTNCDDWKNACYSVFAKMTDVCFRDINSFEIFENLPNVRYAPDAVLSLDIPNISTNNSIKDEYIIISTIDCTMKERSNRLKKCADEYEYKMTYLINKFNEEGTNVILLNSNTTQDDPASKRILARCKNKKKNLIYNYDGNIENLLGLYENARGIIATRLHTIILGWLYDIPVIPIVYDIKVKNLLKSYGFKGLSKDIDDLNEIDFRLIYREIKNYSFKLSERILSDAQKQFEKIDILLK